MLFASFKRFAFILGLLLLTLVPILAATPAEQLFATAKQLLDTGNDQQAISELKKFIASYPDDAHLFEATYLLGCGQQNLQQYDQAISNFSLVTNKATTVTLRAQAYLQLAACYAQQKESAKAVQAYDSCIKLAKDDTDLTAQAYYWMGESLSQSGKNPEAVQAYEKVITIAPKHPLAPWSLYAIGSLALAQQDYVHAISTLEQVTTQYANTDVYIEAMATLGLAYDGRAQATSEAKAKQSDFQKATQILAPLISNEKLSAATRLQITISLARIYGDMQDYANAKAMYNKALTGLEPSSPPTLEILMQRGNMLFNAGNYTEAANDYSTVAERSKLPQVTQQAVYWLGNSRYKQALQQKDIKIYTLAITAFRRFLSLVGKNDAQAPRAGLLLALSLEETAGAGDNTAKGQALLAYKDILTKWPTSREATEAQSGIARLAAGMTTTELLGIVGTLPEGSVAWNVALRVAQDYFRAGNFSEAISAAQKVLSGKPSEDLQGKACYLIAISQHKLNHPKEAIPYYRQVLSNKQASELLVYAQSGLTRAYIDLQQYKEAQDAVKGLLQVSVTGTTQEEKEQALAERLLLIAAVATGNQRLADAISAYQRIITECPSSTTVPFAMMGRAWIADTQKERSVAIEIYKTVIAKYPKHTLVPDAYFRLGLDYREEKQSQKAIEALLKVPPTHSSADRAIYTLACCYRDIGNGEDAIKQFTRVGELFPKSTFTGMSLFQLGDYWRDQQQYANARKWYLQAYDSLPEDNSLRATTLYELGVCAFYQQDYPAAIKSFDSVLMNYQSSDIVGDSLYWKAQSLEKNTQYNLAHDCYLQYIAKYLTGALLLDAAVGAGRVAVANAQPIVARTDLQKTLALCQQCEKGTDAALTARVKNVQPEGQFWLAQSFVAEKNYAEALKNFAAVSTFNMEPWYSRSLLEMARCSALSGDLIAAKRTMLMLQDKFPASEAAKQVPTVARELKISLTD